jgi:hypothetical protein
MTKRQTILTCIIVCTLLLNACEYEFVGIEIPELDETVPVSFEDDLLPIFAANECASCHSSYEMNLSPKNAYQTIVPKLIDIEQPELSKIFLYPNPASSLHQYQKYKPMEAALILTWLKQGADNN